MATAAKRDTFLDVGGWPGSNLRTDHNLARLLAADDLEITESNGVRLPARWYTPAEALATGLPVYPDGVLNLVRR